MPNKHSTVSCLTTMNTWFVHTLSNDTSSSTLPTTSSGLPFAPIVNGAWLFVPAVKSGTTKKLSDWLDFNPWTVALFKTFHSLKRI